MNKTTLHAPASELLIAGMRLVIAEMEPDQRERAIEAVRRRAPGVADRLGTS